MKFFKSNIKHYNTMKSEIGIFIVNNLILFII